MPFNKVSIILGMIPLKLLSLISGPVIVCVLPEPVWPQAKIVPLQPWRLSSTIPLAVQSQTSSWVLLLGQTRSNQNSLWSWSAALMEIYLLLDLSVFTQIALPDSSNSRLFKGRIRITTFIKYNISIISFNPPLWQLSTYLSYHLMLFYLSSLIRH